VKALLAITSFKVKKNLLHDGQRNLSGKMVVASSKDINLKKMKEVTKDRNTTINDLMTIFLSASLK
jgi:hypothetical protein